MKCATNQKKKLLDSTGVFILLKRLYRAESKRKRKEENVLTSFSSPNLKPVFARSLPN